MDSILVLLVGLATGAYFAEDIRKVAPILKPDESATEAT